MVNWTDAQCDAFENEVTSLVDQVKELLEQKKPDRKLVKEKVDRLVYLFNHNEDPFFDIDDVEVPFHELEDKGFFDEALVLLDLMRENVECYLNHPEVFFYIGECYYKMKEYKKAYDYFGKALSYDYDDNDIIYEYRRELRKKLGIEED